MRLNIYAEEILGAADEHGARITLIKEQVLAQGAPHKAIQILIGTRIIPFG